MSTDQNVPIVENLFAAVGVGDGKLAPKVRAFIDFVAEIMGEASSVAAPLTPRPATKTP